jgi:fructokinase
LVKNANSTWLIGHPLLVDLQAQFSCPVTIANDADCFALSEARDGAGADAATVWGIILGTGTGSGIVIHGNLLQGPNSIAGEWGHNPLPAMTEDEAPGPLCYCGRYGCIETFLSGPGMVQDYCRRGGDATCVEAIVDAAAKGEATATATLQRYIERLACATASVINILDPDVIVLGGGVSNIPDLYDRVPALWSRYVFSDTVRTRLLPPRHGDSSGVRGAAWLGVSSTMPGKICRPR